jgi:putative ABC transport system permease protein
MTANLFLIAVKMLFVKKWRTLFSLLGAVFGIGLLAAMLVLYGKMDKALEEQFIERYGNSDMLAGYRHDRLIMSPELVQKVISTEGIAEHGVILVNPHQYKKEYDGPTNGMYYVGADNSSQSKLFYKFHADLGKGEAAVSERLAKRLNLKVGDTAEIPFPSGKTELWKIVEILPDRVAATSAVPDMVIFNLESLQEQFGLQGQANLVLIKLQPGVDKFRMNNQLKQVASDLDVDLMEGLDEAKEMISFLKGIGYALGMLALIASALFVLSNFQISVQERVRELAALRAIGASPGQVFRLVLLEASWIGGIGAAAGLALGVLIANLSSGWISGMLGVQMADAPLPWPGLMLIAAFGWLFFVLLSLIPARKTTKILPVQAARESAFERGTKREQKVSFRGMLVFLAIGAACFVIGSLGKEGSSMRALFSVLGGLSAVIGVFAGVPSLIPPLLQVFSPLMEKVGGRQSFVAVKNLIAERRMSTLTILVITIGITLSVSVTTVLNIVYESSMENLRKTYITDFLVSSSRSYNTELPIGIVEEIEAIPGVKWAVATSRGDRMQLIDYDFSRAQEKWLNDHMEPTPSSQVPQRELVSYRKTDLQKMVDVGLIPPIQGDLTSAAVLPKAYAEGIGVNIGDTLQAAVTVYNRQGQRVRDNVYTFTVAAIVEELPGQPYSDALMFVDRSHPVHSAQGDRNLENYAHTVLVEIDGAKREEAVQGLKSLEGKYAEFRYTDLDTEMRKQERGFAMERSILWSVVCTVMLVGVLGMINTLSASLQSKQREFAILRAISVTPLQMVKMVLTQSFLFALLAVVFGLVTAALMVAGFTRALAIEELFLPWGTIFSVSIAVFALTTLVSLPLSIRMGSRTVTRALSVE